MPSTQSLLSPVNITSPRIFVGKEPVLGLRPSLAPTSAVVRIPPTVHCRTNHFQSQLLNFRAGPELLDYSTEQYQ